MKPEEIEYIRYRMARASETVHEAELLFANGHLHTAVNRLYYSCFYAVSALLLTGGHYSRKHSGVVALFDRLWIKTGRLPIETGRFFHHLFDRRQEGDYEDLKTFDPVDVAAWIEQTKDFISRIAQVVASIETNFGS